MIEELDFACETALEHLTTFISLLGFLLSMHTMMHEMETDPD